MPRFALVFSLPLAALVAIASLAAGGCAQTSASAVRTAVEAPAAPPRATALPWPQLAETCALDTSSFWGVDPSPDVERRYILYGLFLPVVEGPSVASLARLATHLCEAGSESACNVTSFTHLALTQELQDPSIRQRTAEHCAAGNPSSCAFELLYKGLSSPDGVSETDLEAAVQECHSGNAVICQMLTAVSEHLELEPREIRLSEALACRAGDPFGCLALASRYHTGRDVEVDEQRAQNFLTLACEHGMQYWCESGARSELLAVAEVLASGWHYRMFLAPSLAECRAEHPFGCMIAAAAQTFLRPKLDQRLHDAFDGFTRSLLARGCELGDEDSCEAGDLMDQVAIAANGQPAGLFHWLDSRCASDPSVCALAARAYLSKDASIPGGAYEVLMQFARACSKGIGSACTALAKLQMEGWGFESEGGERQDAKIGRTLANGCASGSSEACAWLGGAKRSQGDGACADLLQQRACALDALPDGCHNWFRWQIRDLKLAVDDSREAIRAMRVVAANIGNELEHCLREATASDSEPARAVLWYDWVVGTDATIAAPRIVVQLGGTLFDKRMETCARRALARADVGPAADPDRPMIGRSIVYVLPEARIADDTASAGSVPMCSAPTRDAVRASLRDAWEACLIDHDAHWGHGFAARVRLDAEGAVERAAASTTLSRQVEQCVEEKMRERSVETADAGACEVEGRWTYMSARAFVKGTDYERPAVFIDYGEGEGERATMALLRGHDQGNLYSLAGMTVYTRKVPARSDAEGSDGTPGESNTTIEFLGASQLIQHADELDDSPGEAAQQ